MDNTCYFGFSILCNFFISNRLRDLGCTDIGMTAWFSVRPNPRAGWLAFDDIRTRVTETALS